MAARFREGDWVVHSTTGNIGYVTDVFIYSVKVEFLFHRGKVPIIVPFEDNVELSKLTLLPPEPRIYHQDEMDLALATKDYAWYEELQKLKGEKIDG